MADSSTCDADARLSAEAERLRARFDGFGSEIIYARYSLGHGLLTITAVPRLTQPFTLCRTVK